jgi:murein DD-endopeptidase MepM/ murein hydrolase activator NlpD
MVNNKRNFNLLTTILFSIVIVALTAVFTISRRGVVIAQTVNKDALQGQIDAKNTELQQIQQQLQEQQQKLINTQSQKQTLSSEVGKINSNISQINLNIKSSQVQIDKLNLQIRVLQGQITEAQDNISVKSQAVEELMRQMQQADNENIIMAFLKNKTLSDGVMEAQSLQDLNTNLILSIQQLNDAKEHLDNVLTNTSNTKSQEQVENTNYQNQKEIASDLKVQKQQFLDQTKNQEKAYQDSIKQLQERQTAIALEIEKIEMQLRSEINYKNLPKSIPGLLAVPVGGNLRLTQGYGATNFAKSAYRGKWHNGVDLAAPIGTTVLAAGDGIVVSTDNQDRYCYKGAYGKYVAIKHYNGLTTLYGHLSLYIVKEGDKVNRGQVIGYIGQTGYATGPHLHFGIYDSETFRIDSSTSCGPKMPYGGDLNPLNYVSI